MSMDKTAARRRALLAYVQEHGGGSLSQLVEELGVSKMTVHRDLALLEKRGKIRRVFGAALPVSADQVEPSEAASCMMCLRHCTDHLRYSLSLKGGKQQFACCAHCGLAAQMMAPETVVSAMVADFLSGQPHPAHSSWYVVGSEAAPCCHPSVLAFASRDMATRFCNGFGGALHGHEAALEHLRHAMVGAKSS